MANHIDLLRELEVVLARLEEGAELCRKQLLRTKEAMSFISEADARVRQLLPPDSVSFRIFEQNTKERTQWWKETISGYVDAAGCQYFDDRIALLNTVLDEIAPEFLRREKIDKDQFYFPAGEAYRSKKRFFSIVKTARVSVAIIDIYLDDQVFDYIDSLAESICVRLLTGGSKPIFRTLFASLKAQRANLEARIFNGYHDRFVVLDGAEVWHLGASINGFGKQAFMISKVIDEAEKTRFLSDLEEWWQRGEQV